MLKFSRLLMVAGALIGATWTAAMAQNTMSNEGPASSRKQEAATESRNSSDRVQNHGQAREPNDPVNTGSGGSPPSSPQGDSPSGMQPLPKGESTEDGHKSDTNR